MSLSPAIRKVLVPALLPFLGAGMLILPIASFAQKPAGQPTGRAAELDGRLARAAAARHVGHHGQLHPARRS